MIETLGTLLAIYTFGNIVMVYVMIDYALNSYFNTGFRIKHLIVGILFPFASLFFLITIGIAMLVIKIHGSDFWNKRLF